MTQPETLPPDFRKTLSTIDFQLIQTLVQSNEKAVDWGAMARKAKPPQAIRLNGPSRIRREEAQTVGQDLLAAGKIGVILVAGGQGTRLGFDQPKGMFPIGPLSNRTLFEIVIDQIKALSNLYKVPIPLWIMTSQATHADTVEFFKAKKHFGLTKQDLLIFCQGTMPAVDIQTGKLLRSSVNELALSPNGHGGMLDAFAQSGGLESAANRGIEHFYYAQIDNPLAQICSEELIGFHAFAKSEMTTQVVKKDHALEKVGNVVDIDGKVQIIEYSDLPDEYARQVTADGELLLWAGNIAVHVFSSEFLRRAADSNTSLPYHLAKKKVPFLDADGVLQTPQRPNAFKFEKFIFDLLPIAQNAIAVEIDKSRGFAPVKNAEGAATDTPSIASKAISDLHKSWLRENGTIVADDALVEIHPAFAHCSDSLARQDLPKQILSDTYFEPISV